MECLPLDRLITVIVRPTGYGIVWPIEIEPGFSGRFLRPEPGTAADGARQPADVHQISGAQ